MQQQYKQPMQQQYKQPMQQQYQQPMQQQYKQPMQQQYKQPMQQQYQQPMQQQYKQPIQQQYQQPMQQQYKQPTQQQYNQQTTQQQYQQPTQQQYNQPMQQQYNQQPTQQYYDQQQYDQKQYNKPPIKKATNNKLQGPVPKVLHLEVSDVNNKSSYNYPFNKIDNINCIKLNNYSVPKINFNIQEYKNNTLLLQKNNNEIQVTINKGNYTIETLLEVLNSKLDNIKLSLFANPSILFKLSYVFLPIITALFLFPSVNLLNLAMSSLISHNSVLFLPIPLFLQ
jgi:hypothetical protein